MLNNIFKFIKIMYIMSKMNKIKQILIIAEGQNIVLFLKIPLKFIPPTPYYGNFLTSIIWSMLVW